MNIVKLASIAGMALSIGGTLLSSWAGQKTMNETIGKKVVEEVAKQAVKH